MNKNDIYRVIGIITHYNQNSDHCESIPLGIYDSDNKYQNLSEDEVKEIFLPNGKVFIPEIAKKYNNKDIVEFYTRSPLESKLYENKDIYSIDSRRPIKKLLPKVIMMEALLINSDKCEYNLIDSSLNIENLELYVYDKNTKIIYEKINYNKAIGIRAVKGKSIKGVTYNFIFDETFITENGPLIYFTDDFIPDFSNCEKKFTIDLSTKQQKLECFKKTLFELNKFNNKDIQNIGYLLNQIKNLDFTDLPELIKQRCTFSLNDLELIKITDEEIKKLLSSNSNFGSFIIKKAIQEKQAEIEKESKIQIADLTKDLKLLEAKIEDKKKELIILENQNKTMIETKNIIEKETLTLQNNKEIIYETIKAIMKCNITNQEVQLVKQNIYTEEADLPVNEYLDSEFEYSLINKNTKYILFNKFSLIPSVSYVYAIANSIGNSKVLNLSVEYDWLHYSDFVEHGLLDFIKGAHANSRKFYFLNFDNVNIIPMDCGFSSIFKVFNKELPYFENSTLNLPQNLFISATILPTKNETDIGHHLPFYIKTLFKGIDNPMDKKPLNFERLKNKREFKYEFSKELIHDFKEQIKSVFNSGDCIDTISDYYEF